MAKIEEIDANDEAAGSSSQSKQKMTDEERLALAAKLDKELDDFIDGLEKRRYTEGWPEDRWEEVSTANNFLFRFFKLFNSILFCLGNGQTSIFHERTTKTGRQIKSIA